MYEENPTCHEDMKHDFCDGEIAKWTPEEVDEYQEAVVLKLLQERIEAGELERDNNHLSDDLMGAI